MIFSKTQIEQVMETIEFQHLHFCVYNIGVTILSPEEKKLLKKYGIDVAKIDLPKYSPTKKAFLFGKLAAILKGQTKKIDYNDFLKYLRRGQYIPLTPAERDVLEILENKLGDSIRKESNKVKADIQNLFNERNLKWRMDESFKKLVREETMKGFQENKTKQEVVLEIGHRTGEWERDIGRIVETEMQDIYQYGKLSTISDKKEIKLVYKNVFPGACRHCIALYLTNGVGSAPRLFKISTLISNGTNIGRKTRDWRPVVGTTHPFCRCELEEYRDGDEWSEEKQTFVVPQSKVEESQKIEGKIVVTVGDKKFYS